MQGTERIVKVVRGALKYGLGTRVESPWGTVKFTIGSANIIMQIGHHARGNVAHICIENESDERLEVYGILGGNPGWSEYYGWTKQGPWVKYIENLLDELEREINAKDRCVQSKTEEDKQRQLQAEQEKIKKFESMFMVK